MQCEGSVQHQEGHICSTRTGFALQTGESVEVTPSPHTAHSVYRVILLIIGRLGSVVILPQFRIRGFQSMRNVSKSILLNELWPDLNRLNCDEQT